MGDKIAADAEYAPTEAPTTIGPPHVTNDWTPDRVMATFGAYVDHTWTPPIATFIYQRQ